MRGKTLLLIMGLASVDRLGAAAPATGATQRYLEYKAAVDKSTSLQDLVPFMTAEVAQRTARAPQSVLEGTWGGLKSVSGLLSKVTVAKETVQGDTAKLQVKAIDAPGGNKPTSGTVDMVREDGQWKVRSETWAIGAQKAYTLNPGVTSTDWESASPSEPAAAASAPGEPGLDDPLARAAVSDIRTIISAEAAYQSANQGYYDTLACLARPTCIPGTGPLPYVFIKPELASLAARGGYRRRFDAGGSSVARDPNRKSASPSSMDTYAYWIIPDPPAPGRRARCGDASGVICEMPDASAPATKGECPIQQGCQLLR